MAWVAWIYFVFVPLLVGCHSGACTRNSHCTPQEYCLDARCVVRDGVSPEEAVPDPDAGVQGSRAVDGGGASIAAGAGEGASDASTAEISAAATAAGLSPDPGGDALGLDASTAEVSAAAAQALRSDAGMQ